MSLNRTSNSNSFAARFLSAPRTTLAALLTLGIGVLAPQLAHADDSVVAGVDETAAAPAPSDIARPLSMRGLGTGSSVGVSVDSSDTSLDAFGDTIHLYSGVVKLDGEVSVGGHFKLFGSIPFTGVTTDTDHAEKIAGHGNLTLGAQLQGGQGNLHAALGGSFSKWGEDDSVFAIYQGGDVAAFANDHTIVQGFATVRGGTDDRFVQAQLTYTSLLTDGSSGNDSEDTSFGQAMIGGGMRLGGGTELLAEAGVVRELRDLPEDRDIDPNLYVADVGVRGRITGTQATWGTKVTFLSADGVTSVGGGFELRTDLPGLSGAE
jgi:hypothetical protein